ncbi:MAG: GTP pyrophosphokinase (EC, (p)ppGpp synthetase II / Guanosine-3',5'-bis(diphosphate) 3'-pyrophosphohydrolase (EC [uncultured Campylobacterales bacterium]|uniref:GTP pyrophosphokinase (EC, (P)ppGpp synthetase II / Guanosine-3',5'-bis(Diphosphate) 3'-pyrophosphohydrolase (EC)) n=1 Tax=uncultured Campylobacterales bacterium TaxID=352960 RepID=A0A6S6SSZ6_9BACT|nr:MAG: GTP pyrophosphokinase (EC, (p)ppGpp synthetase II / Guanosine-3',5'-bis(diphosphate) 3'-pyrophosphohydrolase (EC [uncultured Campylobacterales bacterium]
MKNVKNFLDLVESSKQCIDLLSAKRFFRAYCPTSELIEKALELSIKSHEGQNRKTGHPYIIHPLSVAGYIGFLGGNEESICAALLHDTVEDTKVTLKYIKQEFGTTVEFLVDALTKPIDKDVDKIKIKELTFAKLTSNASKDVRVLVIKLCDRTHNLITIGAMIPKKIEEKCRETLSFYIPLANRLGMNRIKLVLENICFQYLFPQGYKEVSSFIDEHQNEFQIVLNNYILKVEEILMKSGFNKEDYRVEKRIKEKYSIYLKTQRKGIKIHELSDILAVRIILPKKSDCYHAMGLIHEHFTPEFKKFKDYIASPKDNGYQTLHTTITNQINHTIENQIRTFEMDQSAKLGIAAHWRYKNSGEINETLEERSISHKKYQKTFQSFYKTDSLDQIDEISIFTPDKKKHKVQKNDTLIDFAYKIDEVLGKNISYGIVNGKKVPPIYKLNNNDHIKIVTSTKNSIKHSWRYAVNSPKAKQYLEEAYLHELSKINILIVVQIFSKIFDKSGDYILEWINENRLLDKYIKSSLSIESIKRLIKFYIFSKISNKSLKKTLIKRYTLTPQFISNLVIYSNFNVTKTSIAHCCHPKVGDEIVGFLDSKNTLEIHNKLCSFSKDNLKNNLKNVCYTNWKIKTINQFEILLPLKDNSSDITKLFELLSTFKLAILKIKTLENFNEENLSYILLEVNYSEVSNIKRINQKIIDTFSNIKISEIRRDRRGNKKIYLPKKETSIFNWSI